MFTQIPSLNKMESVSGTTALASTGLAVPENRTAAAVGRGGG